MKKLFLLIPVALIMLVSCGSGNKTKPGDDVNDTVKNENKIVIDYPKDSVYDQLASLLAGDDASHFNDTFGDSQFWKEYKISIDTPWQRIQETRLDHIFNWSDSVVKPLINDTVILFYPFSGPDFLHAYQLFPNANEYVFIAMEKLGTIPALHQSSSEQLKAYLDATNFALRDIYKRSYFITGNMEQDLRKQQVDGVLPIILVFLHKTGHEIYDFGYYRLNNDGKTFTEIQKPTNTLDQVECIRFKILRQGDDKLKDFTYFYADISDSGFTKAKVLKTYLDNLRGCNTFIKSASYLSHYGTFSNIRDLVLLKSDAVLEDDTGVPYRYFTHDTWTPHLFGVYVKPIADFPSSYLYQKDLASAYDSIGARPLPFSLGYHWRTGEQNWLLFVRKK
ncbi:MAG TPA: hypothetical protein PLM49_00715 [Bacteroidales bacterium]|nr:hypothetical protein [Bacteroidales bacterium]